MGPDPSLWPEDSDGGLSLAGTQIDAPNHRPRACRYALAGGPQRGVHQNLDFDIGSSLIEPERPERGQRGRVDSGLPGFVADRLFEIGHPVERRVRLPPRPALKQWVIGTVESTRAFLFARSILD